MKMTNSTDRTRLWHAFLIAVAGIVATLAALLFLVGVFHLRPDVDKVIPALLAPVLTTIGTLVGAVAGHAAGGAGTERARAQAEALERQVRAYERALDPNAISQVHQNNPGVF